MRAYDVVLGMQPRTRSALRWDLPAELSASSMPQKAKTILQNVAIYAVAGVIIWFVARGVSWRQIIDSAAHANLWLFVPAALGGVACWFFGETFLFAKLFSYFHKRTTFRELLLPNA